MEMTKRNYVIKQADAEDCPIIDSGKTNFYIDDKDIVPAGYILDSVQNSPKLKTVYVLKEKKMENQTTSRIGLETDERLLNTIESLVSGCCEDENSPAGQFWADGYFEDLEQVDLIDWLNKNDLPESNDDVIHWGASPGWAIAKNGVWIQDVF